MQPANPNDEATVRLARTAMAAGALPGVLIGLVLAVVAALVVGVGAVLGAVVLGAVLAAAGAAAVAARSRSAVDRLLDGLGAVPLAEGSRPRLENLLEGLGATSGVPDPEVHLVDSDAMNALVAVTGERTAVVVTSGLLDGLGRLELEAVLANLLARARDRSAAYATAVVGLLGASPTVSTLLRNTLGEQRAVMSDLAAVDLTRYPPGLISALASMQRSGTAIDGVPAASSPLWLAPVSGAGPLEGGMSDDEAPLSTRIAVLGEL